MRKLSSTIRKFIIGIFLTNSFSNINSQENPGAPKLTDGATYGVLSHEFYDVVFPSAAGVGIRSTFQFIGNGTSVVVRNGSVASVSNIKVSETHWFSEPEQTTHDSLKVRGWIGLMTPEEFERQEHAPYVPIPDDI